MGNELGRLYGDLAHLWPLMSPPADYAAEAAYWRRELRSHLGPGKHRILDLGSGGGHFLSHFAGEFAATAVDLSDAMLAHSRRLNPGVMHHIGDMRTVRLNTQFDAVLIHDAIAYMTTEADLLAAFTTAHAHLRKGGLLITAPDFYIDTFRSPWVHHETHTDGDSVLTHIEYSVVLDLSDGKMDTVFIFFVKEAGELRVELDRHVTGLFRIATWQRLLGEADFSAGRVPVDQLPGDDYVNSQSRVLDVTGRNAQHLSLPFEEDWRNVLEANCFRSYSPRETTKCSSL